MLGDNFSRLHKSAAIPTLHVVKLITNVLATIIPDVNLVSQAPAKNKVELPTLDTVVGCID